MRNVLLFLFCLLSFKIFSQSPLQVTVSDSSGNENFNVSCSNNLDATGCLLLNVKYPKLKETSGYTLSTEAYNLPVPLTQGTALNANYDDLFAEKLDLPFKFCFFRQSFQSVIVGSNGMITFDIDQLGKINFPNVDWANPNPNLPHNSIFGAYHDIVFSSADSSEIYYSVVGSAPYRKFIISFYNGRVSGCTNQSSSQIVLHETTNVIDVFVEKKDLPCPTSRFTNALIGIMNADGTSGLSPADRNTGVWQSFQEAYRFTPNGNTIIPEISWTDSAGQNLGSGVQTSVCPTKNEIYTANVKFNICGTDAIILKDDFALTFDPTYPVARNHTENYCAATSLNIDLDSFKANVTSQDPANFMFTYYETRANAQNAQNAIPSDYTLTANKIIYVRIQNPSVPTCFRIAVLTLNFLSRTLPKDTVEICDTNNDGIERNYELSLINKELFPAATSITYYRNQSDADNDINAITNIDITTSTTVWMRVSMAGCTYVLGPLKFAFKPGVNLNSPINYSYSICDINDDNTEPFQYDVTLGPLISTDPGAIFKAYLTYAAAQAGTSAPIKTIKEGQYIVYVRVEIPNGCFAIAEVNMNVTFTRVQVKKKDVYICFNGTDDITVDLLTLSSDMLIAPASVPGTSYHATAADAAMGVNPISTTQTITEDGNLVTKIFYVLFYQAYDCYTVRPITVNLVHPIIVNSSGTACDFNNDSTELVQLSQFNQTIVGTQNATTQYYETLSDAQSGLRRITSTTVNGTKQIFVKITSFGCSEIYPFNISLTATPAINTVVNIDLNSICDNNNDGVELYDLQLAQLKIYGGTDVAYTYYRNYNPVTHVFSDIITNPGSFPVPQNATVYARVKYSSNTCFSPAQINIRMTFLPAVIVKAATLNKCDPDFNLNETFQLNDARSQLFNPSENTYPLSDLDISYYIDEARANLGDLNQRIINDTISTKASEVLVWARFQHKSLGCYSVAPIKLISYQPPKAINSTIRICDDNLDGKYAVNLLNYVNQMVDIPNTLNTFKFYPSLSEAKGDRNAIADPENYISEPFPRQLWVRVQNIPGCNDFASINLVQSTKINIQNSTPYQLVVCKQGDSGIADLNQFESRIYSSAGATFSYYPSLADLNSGTNIIGNPSNYAFSSATGPNVIYVKVSAPGLCPDKAEIRLSVKPAPEFDIPTQYICPGDKLDYTITIPGYTITNYVWTNPAGTVIATDTPSISGIGETGTYTLTVKADNGCSYTDTFEIAYYDVPVIDRLEANGNTYIVYASGNRPILYSSDGVTWQSSNIFNDLTPGIQTFYVRYDGEDCIVEKEGVILNIPNVITPNGDGYNDLWTLKNLHVFGGKTTNVRIYDRFQVMIFEQNSNTEVVWDGKIRGRVIPTTSYWYIITLPDGRQFNGWIVLKNR